MNLKGEPAYVGRHCGSHRYDVTPELVAFYQDALDDRSPLPEGAAPPLLFHSECYQFVGDWYLKNLFGNLHAQQDWELFGPLPVDGSVTTRSTIIDRYTKRGRDYVVNETDVSDASDGRLLVRGRTHQSFLPPKDRAADSGFVVDEKTAGRKQPRREEQAEKLGFPNIVVQGMMSTCFVSQVMQEAFGAGWITGGKAALKLVNVLWVDESVTAYGQVREEAPEGTGTRVHCDVWVEKGDGTRVIVGDASALRPEA
jgi:hypothetical protein